MPDAPASDLSASAEAAPDERPADGPGPVAARGTGGPVLLYDGDCALCNASVRWLYHRDPAGRIRYAALQSRPGRFLLVRHGLDPEALDTVVFVEDGRAFVRSTAALRALRHLRFPWPALSWLRVIPAFLRDAIYRVVARNRIRWFGRVGGGSDHCEMPTPAWRGRELPEDAFEPPAAAGGS